MGGWIVLSGGRIHSLGQGSCSLSGKVENLGDVAILPGLVNAHTHLEFSDCRQPIGKPGTPLQTWIGQVIRSRGQRSADQTREAIAAGLAEAVGSGTTLIGEISTPVEAKPDATWLASNQTCQLVSFAEVLGLSPERGNERLSAAESFVRNHESAGYSPHAPYSTPWHLIQQAVHRAVRDDCGVAMHVAESPDERPLIQDGTGPFAESLRQLDLWRDGLFPWASGDYCDLIRLLAQAKFALIVHGNDLNAREIECLGQHPNATVVYCPRTHAFFGHRPHPVRQLLDAGINVALGTDSRASNPDLSLWGEVQWMLAHRHDVTPMQVLELATQRGAQALGLADQYGTLTPGKSANLAVLPTAAVTLEQLIDDMANRVVTPHS
ncbi:MAG: amidohydrolase family protein [Planctomycetota bacterium]